MSDLSPAALAVWQQYCGIVEEHGPARLGLAAALRAAADQLTPYTVSEMDGAAFARNKLLAIAAEIKAQ
jgi:hypothetical protein